MIVLIDADILVYQAGYGAETFIPWDEDQFSNTADLTKAKQDFDAMVESILHATDSDKGWLALSCASEENFRRTIWPLYKAPRHDPSKRSAKPLLYQQLRDYAREKYVTRERDGLEADDVLGILATMPAQRQGLRVIASTDKDLMTIPGLHYNWRTPERGVFEVKDSEARHTFYTQVLTGDSTDNYPGLPGVGPKKALKLIEGCKTDAQYWRAVCAAYTAKGLTEDDALVQARCARILRAQDYDMKMKEVKLWRPRK